ncbi:MAG: SUMF1/EgtB/PvdO family nonheme iron enzyme [Anaerolineae bacterium]
MAWDRVSLADAMIARMDVNEVKDLCFRLGVDDENLDRSTKNSLVRSLISYMERRQQLDVLIDELVRLRPDIKPPSAPASKDTSAATPPAREQDAQPQARPRIEVAPPPPTPESGDPKLGDRMTDDKGVTMVYVPPGKFTMGASDISDREKPPHEVIIARGFWLDLTPVTNAMYAQFVKDGGYKKQECWTKGGWAWVQKAKGTGPKDYQRFTDPEQPRVGVTWFEADAYCRWRGGRLPTEAEWEWAARGPENRQYPWGNEFDAKRVVFGDNSGGKTAPVNANTRLDGASWVGALDMSGNVWEWTSSLYQPYPYKAEDERESLEDDKKARVVRGGSWYNSEDVLLAAFRLDAYPSYEYYSYGFRCARSS